MRLAALTRNKGKVKEWFALGFDNTNLPKWLSLESSLTKYLFVQKSCYIKKKLKDYISYSENTTKWTNKLESNTILLKEVVNDMLVYDTNANRYYKEWFGTQAEYDNIIIKEKNTMYGVRQANDDVKFYFMGYDSTILEGEKRNTTKNLKDGIHFDEWIGNEGEFSAMTNMRGNTKYSVVNNNAITDYIKVADKADNRLSLSVAGGPFGLEVYNVSDDPMPIDIAGEKSLEECISYQGGGITVYTDNIVKVRTYEGFYDYFLANQRQMSEIMMLPSEEVVKDKEYYDKLVNGLALQYNKQIENAPNLLRNAQVLQDVNTPAPINFGCTVFPDGTIWMGDGYSVGTKDRPPCPVDVPNGKLTFATGATSETHSFVFKDLKYTSTGNTYWLMASDNWNWETAAGMEVTCDKSIKGALISKNYKNCEYSGDSFGVSAIKLQPQIQTERKFDSLKQLLIYKGNLTEAELKAELAKTIRLR